MVFNAVKWEEGVEDGRFVIIVGLKDVSDSCVLSYGVNEERSGVVANDGTR
ncbi:hypothetical protein A2U01_0011312 [Trifolium medium]|uniref:Uncharacterized protein n=1 Tax=Trifolium medium TaxID=97028 RepID=A0A392MSA9_9FABA|nr:hypothetical protein [Trifolium medium]